MAEARRSLADIVEAVVDGQPVDMSGARCDELTESAAARLEALGVVARVARAGRQQWAHLTPHGEPSRWGPLQLLERISSGSYGDVFRAWDRDLQREVALKLFRPDATGQTRGASLAEAQRLARARHAGLITVHGVAEHDGRVGIWMPLVRGETLAARVARTGPLPVHDAVRLVHEVADAVAALHAVGVLHRDITGKNVLVDERGRAVLVDLGAGTEQHDIADLALAAGTPLSLPPESFLGAPASEQTDVYALGALLFHAVSGRYPVEAETMEALRAAHAAGTRVTASQANPALPRRLIDVLEQALAPRPRDRYRSARDLRDALSLLLSTSRRPKAIAWCAAWLAAVAMAVAVVRPSTQPPDRRAVGSALLVLDPSVEPVLPRHTRAAVIAALKSAGVPLRDAREVSDGLARMRYAHAYLRDLATAGELSQREGGTSVVLRLYASRADALTLDVFDASGVQRLATATRDLPAAAQAPSVVRGLARAALATLEPRLPSPTPVGDYEPVTTSSNAALQLYTDAYRLGLEQARNFHALLTMTEQALHEDPAFAAAHTWRAWCLYRTGASPASIRDAAQRAVSLAANTSAREQHWIRGSAHFLSGDPAAAIPEYRALVTLDPDHYWGTWNLVSGLRELQRHDDAATYARVYADRHPEDPRPQEWVLDALLNAQRWQAARDWMRTMRTPPSAPAAARVALTETFAAVHHGRVWDALAHLRAVEAREREWSNPRGQALARLMADILAGLGRPTDAARLIARLTDDSERATRHADLALLEGDLAAVRAACAAGLVSRGPARLENLQQWIAGASEEPLCVERLRSQPPRSHRQPLSGHAEGLRVRGRAREAAEELAAIVSQPIPPEAAHYRALLSYSRLQLAAGDRAGALRELERLRTRRRSYAFAAAAAAWATATELMLVRAYIDEGRTSDARRVAREVRARLAPEPDAHVLRVLASLERELR